MLTRAPDDSLRPALVFVLAADRSVVEELAGRIGPRDELHALKNAAAFNAHSRDLRPDVVVVDWSGLGDTPLHRISQTTEAPIIVLDRDASAHRRDEANDAGAFEYLAWDEDRLDHVHHAFERALARDRHSGQLRALGEVAAGVAHDFNNVLEVVLGRLDLIRIQAQKGGDVEPHIRIVEKAVQDASSIVSRIRDFSRPLATQPWEDLDLERIVRDSADFVRTRVHPPATLTVKTETISGIYRGHRGELREVLVNILNNACDAIGPSGRVAITLSSENGNPFVTIADDGPGIPAEIRGQIFEPFFTTKDRSGSGLGLSVSRDILRRHDVGLSFHTEHGRGTTFTLRFNHAHHPTPRRENGSRGVLVVDDDRAVGELIADILSEVGYRVEFAHSADAALNALSNAEYGVLLTDLDLDGESGWELARQARRERPSLTIGLMTGWPIGVEDRDIGTRGVDFVLTKPFSPQKLVALLE
ncbi:MAG: ATP-binding protein [Myxococcota bacterium]